MRWVKDAVRWGERRSALEVRDAVRRGVGRETQRAGKMWIVLCRPIGYTDYELQYVEQYSYSIWCATSIFTEVRGCPLGLYYRPVQDY